MSELTFLLYILTEKSKNFFGLDFFCNFSKILGILEILEDNQTYSTKQNTINKIKKKIENILKLEKIAAVKILNRFKK